MSHPKNSSIFKIPFLETLFFSNSKLTKLFELYSPGSEKKQRMKRTNPVRGLNNPDIVKNTLLLVLLDQLERICVMIEPNFYPVLVPPQDNLLHPQLQQQAFKFKSLFCENSFEIQLGRKSKSSTYLPQ